MAEKSALMHITMLHMNQNLHTNRTLKKIEEQAQHVQSSDIKFQRRHQDSCKRSFFQRNPQLITSRFKTLMGKKPLGDLLDEIVQYSEREMHLNKRECKTFFQREKRNHFKRSKPNGTCEVLSVKSIYRSPQMYTNVLITIIHCCLG